MGWGVGVLPEHWQKYSLAVLVLPSVVAGHPAYSVSPTTSSSLHLAQLGLSLSSEESGGDWRSVAACFLEPLLGVAGVAEALFVFPLSAIVKM